MADAHPRPSVAAVCDIHAQELEALFVRLRPALIQHVARKTGSVTAAEDLIQELFLRLLRRRDLFALDNLEGYVVQAATNLVRDGARRDAVRRADAHVWIEDAHVTTEEPDAERVVEARQRLDLLMSAVQRLPRRTRAVLVLSRFEHMTYSQIAAELGISVSAVEKHISKALRELQKWRA